jgi:ferritin-like metal-binding protein YciE
MADPNERDAKLIQYMQEAYGKEQELELALQADILLTTKDPYKKRLKQHLKETKAHSKALDRRIKKLGGGKSHVVQTLVGKATAAVKAPIHAVRGSGDAEKMLKNAKTQYTAEAEEISTYLALEHFATKVRDSETAKLARDIRREEERMAKFLEGQIKQLSAAVATDEVPARLRRAAGKKSSKRSTKKAAKSSAKPAAKSSKTAAKKSPAKSVKKATKKAAKKASAKSSAAKSGAKKAAKKASAASKGAKASAKKAGTSKPAASSAK